MGSDQEAEKPLRRVAELAREWLPFFGPDGSLGSSKLNLFLAQALQSLAEGSGDHSALIESETAYRKAISGLSLNKDPILVEAKSGLAALLQVIGESENDADQLRKSVTLQKELVDGLRKGGDLNEEAGSLENLAGSLMSLARAVGSPEAELLYSEAKGALERVILIRRRYGDADRELIAQQRLSELQSVLDQVQADGSFGRAVD